LTRAFVAMVRMLVASQPHSANNRIAAYKILSRVISDGPMVSPPIFQTTV
jgi:hypothetical protein